MGYEAVSGRILADAHNLEGPPSIQQSWPMDRTPETVLARSLPIMVTGARL